MDTTLSVAGVGASAGGLAATVELLRHLGPEPKIAVVIIHHLDPDHDSSLSEILSRVTEMPVASITDGMKLATNQVYVAPPNHGINIHDRKLNLVPRAESAGLHLVIDQFFESLASDRAVQALGVVLSGSGHDGSIGIKAIKTEGGITFAQDASAEYRGMPSSAISTGCVDFILPPEGIAKELIRIGERAPPISGDEGGAGFQRIITALRRSSGIDFSNYKQSTIRRRVERRMVIAGLSNFEAYADLVERTPEELRAVSDEVLIHVTSFFRDPETYEALKTLVFPKLLSQRPRESSIRVWVPGCSSGEEVYSLAIALLEHIQDARPEVSVKLFGTDVSTSTIDIARAGRYPASIEREISKARLERFFTRLDGGYQVRKDLRDLCVFARQDATRDPPFAGMDLISCRNLMIYLGSPLQDRILPIFHYALKDTGFLVLGTAESVRAFPGFAPVDGRHRIYARTAAAPRMIFDFSDRRMLDEPRPEPLVGRKASSALDVQREADRLVLDEFAPAGVVVSDDLAIVQFRGRTGAFLEPVPGVPSFDLVRMVREELRLPLRQTVDEARTKQTVARRSGLSLRSGSQTQDIELEVVPFRVASTAQRFFIVLFRELRSVPREPIASEPSASPQPEIGEAALGQELASTRHYLQSVIEQLEASNEELKAANEEIVSSNEELRSTNEELQMAKEELQATNEELRTVNDEMTVRNAEATRLNDDLSNLLTSVEMGILIIGRDARVRRYTPAAARAFHLSPSDIGRPLAQTRPIIPAPELSTMMAEVLERLSAITRTVQDDEGRWYQLTVRPYVTADNRIDGTVITAFDIDQLQKKSGALDDAQKYSESIVDTVRECLVVLDSELKVRTANHPFLEMFGWEKQDVQGRRLDELGRGDWNIPGLRARLESLRGSERIDDYRVERTFEQAGKRIFLLNATRIDKSSSILLALEDATQREQAEERLKNERRESEKQLRDYQAQLQQMAFEAALTEERERRRIAIDLHDRIGQSLALAQIKLGSMRDSIAGAPRDSVDEAVALVAQSVADTRELMFELSPPVLYDLGLKEAISWLAEEMEKRDKITIEVRDDGFETPVDDATAALVYRAVRELLVNIVKHARSSRASVTMRRTEAHIDIEVEDKGVGFDPKLLTTRSLTSGFGLFSVREQITKLGGTLDLSSAPAQGTRVIMRVPLKQEPKRS